MNINDLRYQQQLGATDVISALRTVEINAIDICNRSCSFCPRNDPKLYTGKQTRISLDLISKIATDLNEIEYTGRVSFVGFGEPLLFKQLVEAISIIKTGVPFIKWIEVITNADYLTRDVAQQLADAGCTNISVSMYDSDISTQVSDMLSGIDIELVFKHCYAEKFELALVNRSEILLHAAVLPLEKPCYLPFYKMFVDVDGKVLVCNNDWGRNGVVGDLQSASIKEIWLGEELTKYRAKLANGQRAGQEPCMYCNINGTVYGQNSFDQFVQTALTSGI